MATRAEKDKDQSGSFDEMAQGSPEPQEDQQADTPVSTASAPVPSQEEATDGSGDVSPIGVTAGAELPASQQSNTPEEAPAPEEDPDWQETYTDERGVITARAPKQTTNQS